MMMKCTICFESFTGRRTNDYFVSTKNGHVFHYCCALEYIAGGSSLCPLCDEDLRFHTFVKLNSQGAPVPAVPRKPGTTWNDNRPRTPTPTRVAVNSNYPWPSEQGQQASQAQSSNSRLPAPSFCVQPDYVFKIVVLGDFNVGKSSLLQRYADDTFDPFVQHTVGCDLRVKVIPIAGKIIRLNLWDTAGQERHRAVVDMYLRKADGIIFCFDITNASSFVALNDWFQFSQRTLPSNSIKIIVGTKSDLWNQRAVRSQRIKDLAESWNAQYIFTSAKDAINVEVVFRSLAALIMEHRLPSAFSNASTLPSAPPLTANADKDGTIKLFNPFTNSKNDKKKKKRVEDCCN